MVTPAEQTLSAEYNKLLPITTCDQMSENSNAVDTKQKCVHIWSAELLLSFLDIVTDQQAGSLRD